MRKPEQRQRDREMRPANTPPRPRRHWFSQRRRTPLKADAPFEIERHGLDHSPWEDLYHWLITMSWPGFLCLTLGLYIFTNFLFATAYLLGGDCIAGARPGSVNDYFFFSVQTMATIGYGAMAPKTDYANILVAFEALVGLLGVAMATGLMFARFSRPTARVVFSRVALIAPYNGTPMLMFRAANQRGNQILEARLWVTLLKGEVSLEGQFLRRIHDLPLIRRQSPFFSLSWLAMHPIDEHSPLHGETPESLAASDAQILIILTGTDETVGQTVHARQSYFVRDILWNMRFVDIISTGPNGKRKVDYTYLHDVLPL